MLKEILEGGDRALVISHADEERVARLAEPLRNGHAAGRRLAAARAPVRLRVRADPQGRGRGAHPGGGAGHHLHATSAAWPRRSSRSGTRSSCPTCTRTCSGSTSCARPRACCSTARPAAARRSSPRRWRTRWPSRSRPSDRAEHGRRSQGGQELLPEHQGPRAAQQVRRRDRAAHPAGLPAGQGEGQRGHAGHRVLRRDGLDLPHPRLRACPATWRTRSCRSCSARSTGSRAWRTSS